VLPNSVRERQFDTPSKRSHFTVQELPPLVVPPGHYLMMTIRSHDQFNTTVYSGEDRYRGISNGRRVVLLPHDDIDGARLAADQLVDVTSHFDGQMRIVRGFRVVPYDLPRGCAAMYFPEANPLVPVDSMADKSHTPTYKSVVISIAPSHSGE
jgi:anaerobic selenocysteine-containing dehydrogenase